MTSSRIVYGDDDWDPQRQGLWEGQRKRALYGRPGQRALRELEATAPELNARLSWSAAWLPGMIFDGPVMTFSAPERSRFVCKIRSGSNK